MKKILITFTFIFIIIITASAQNDSLKTAKKKTKAKKGWKFGGALPAISYDSDLGFKYGILANVYDWGDGSSYPDYKKSLYAEWSRTTKGNGINNFIYEDRDFFKTGIRFKGDINYILDKALDFYGFNGYQTKIDLNHSKTGTNEYLSRMYYRQNRKLLKISIDFEGKIRNSNLRWLAGFNHYGIKISSVDIDKLNKGKKPEDMLPSLDSVPGFYEKMLSWGAIPDKQKNGGNSEIFKVGAVYDTRDNEACPMKGIWVESMLQTAFKFKNAYNWGQIVTTYRQYFTLIPVKLSFTYRLIWQHKLWGEKPYYILPFYFNTKDNRDGLGGSKTIRGVLRNRVIGDGYVLGNFEFRWKFLNTTLFKQDFYIALSTFADIGRVTQYYKYDKTNIPTDLLMENDNFHFGVGGGLRFALNQNFIVAIEYGRAIQKQDGVSGLYINLGWIW